MFGIVDLVGSNFLCKEALLNRLVLGSRQLSTFCDLKLLSFLLVMMPSDVFRILLSLISRSTGWTIICYSVCKECRD